MNGTRPPPSWDATDPAVRAITGAGEARLTAPRARSDQPTTAQGAKSQRRATGAPATKEPDR